MLKRVVIIGAGDQGAVAESCLGRQKDLEFVGFLDDSSSCAGSRKIVGKVSDFGKFRDCYFHVAIGKNPPRRRIFELLKESKCNFINLAHPRAFVEDGVSLGENVFVGANAYVNVGSSIGDNTIINNGCVIEHDNLVGKHCHLTPGVVTGGGVKIGDSVFVGLRSVIRDHIELGEGSFIGMGSVVVKDVPAGVMVYNRLELITKDNKNI